MKIVSIVKRPNGHAVFLSTDEGDSNGEMVTLPISFSGDPGARLRIEKEAIKLARTVGASLYPGAPEERSIDFEPGDLELVDEFPEGVRSFLAAQEFEKEIRKP